jgi:hypothetical protein
VSPSGASHRSYGRPAHPCRNGETSNRDIDARAQPEIEASRLGSENSISPAPSNSLRSWAAFPGPLRLDVSNVTFMDSTGLRMILLRLRDGPITFLWPSVQVVRFLDLCGVSGVRGLTVETRLS